MTAPALPSPSLSAAPFRRAAALAVLAALALAALPAHSAPAVPAESAESAETSALPALPTMHPSDDGLYVLDDRARLAWPRCVEGMEWNGRTCTGQARLFTYSEAQALATARWKADGVRWRLPRVPELRRLVNRSRQPPTVDPVLFPATPTEWHWTGTASVNTAPVNPYNYGNVARGGAGESGLRAQQGWAVDMESGEARGNVGKGARLPVRLVRPQP